MPETIDGSSNKNAFHEFERSSFVVMEYGYVSETANTAFRFFFENTTILSR